VSPQSKRRPVIVGIAQHSQKLDDPRLALSPLELMEKVIRAAAEDAGALALVGALDALCVPKGLWRYGDPGRLLAERLGSPSARTILGALSGHIVQVLLDRACREIEAGRADVIAFAGGESENSKRRLERSGIDVHWHDATPGTPDEKVGRFDYVRMEEEERAGIMSATALFGLCETSLRRTRGESPGEHRDRLADLQAGMSRIASTHPHAWIQESRDAESIRNPGPGNRMVHYPYTKLMTSNISVDQSAAFIICSSEAAERFGIPASKQIHLLSATEMSFGTSLKERLALHHHPGQVLAAQRALELAEISPADLDHVDVYSCFPFAVQAGASALGLGLDPLPSVTGGMTFFGGPLGSYVMHSKVSLFERLRAEPGSIGVVGSLGGHYAHFGYGIYSTDPGAFPSPRIEDVSDAFAALPRRRAEQGREGPVTIESYTVDVGHEGPNKATFATLTDDGVRVFARSYDRDLMRALLADEDVCGRRGQLKDGILEVA
jgi:acetyl-CoA C-acetyltransferase